MKKIISGLLACAALLLIGTSASAESSTKNYDSKKGAAYSVTATIMQKQLTLDIVVPTKLEAAITRTYNIKTNEKFDINDSETGVGNIDSTLMAMCFFSPEYQIVNNSDVPIKVFANLSAKTAGKAVLFEDLERNVEEDDKKNLRLWLSHSMTEGGSKAQKDENGQRIFDADRGDILITKKESKTASVVFDRIEAKTEDGSTDNVGYFRINGQAKEIPQPYWDVKDGVTIKFVLKVTPASEL